MVVSQKPALLEEMDDLDNPPSESHTLKSTIVVTSIGHQLERYRRWSFTGTKC
jgi:hypothetical protein